VVQEQEGTGEPAKVMLVAAQSSAATTIGEMLREGWPHGLVISQTGRILDATHELLEYGATCVLLDAGPGGSPVAGIEQLRTAAPHTPIITLAASRDEELGMAAVAAGAQDCLVMSELSGARLARAIRFAVERKRLEAVLAHQALHDPLTGLPNRTLFLDRLRVALDRSRRNGSPVTVMFLDVDGFKEVNDTLGHAAGDRLLALLADRFRGLMRPMDTAARYGGDEFTFLFEGLAGEREAGLIAHRVSHAAGLPVALGDVERSVPVSIGVTMVSDPSTSSDQAISDADTAMYRAKKLGGARVEVTAASARGPAGAAARAPADADAAGRSELEADLREAIARSQLRVHYQPRVALDAGSGVVGFEALVRWNHPERGLIGPEEFIGVAEETGLIVEIGEWVVREALAHVRGWRRSRPGLTVSVNLSARQLDDPELVWRLGAAVRAGADEPGVLCLEVTERSVSQRPEVARRQLGALRELGIKVAIDRFGAGACPTSTIERLPVDMLKIDRSLVSGLGPGPGERESVGAAVALGHTLGLDVVAEGVETDSQLEQVRALGCDGAQGFLFSAAIPGAGVDELLARH